MKFIKIISIIAFLLTMGCGTESSDYEMRISFESMDERSHFINLIESSNINYSDDGEYIHYFSKDDAIITKLALDSYRKFFPLGRSYSISSENVLMRIGGVLDKYNISYVLREKSGSKFIVLDDSEDVDHVNEILIKENYAPFTFKVPDPEFLEKLEYKE